MSSRGVPEWSLADRLRKIRRDRRLTQEQIADILGIKPVTWASWESGRSRPHDVVEIAGLIETRFGVPAAWTLGVLDKPGGVSQPEDATAIQPRRRWTDADPTGGGSWTDGLEFAALA